MREHRGNRIIGETGGNRRAYFEIYDNCPKFICLIESIADKSNKVNNKRYKFLKEQPRDRTGRQYCNYMGRIVLSNRYVNYRNHSFVSPNDPVKFVKPSHMARKIVPNIPRQQKNNNYKNIKGMVIV